MEKQTVISLKNLKKSYGKKDILKGINLDIEKGDLFGIIGMSGSGKTTLLNSIVGFTYPEEGDVLYHIEKSKEKDKMVSVFRKPLHVRNIFGFATQEPSFYPKLTIEENLIHFGSLYGLKKKIINTNVDYLLKLTDLAASKKILAQNLSGGMQKRLGIACSLINNPQVLILDEPTADLDPILRADMWSLIKKINEQGTTIILASHFLTEMEGLCNKIGILHDGMMKDVGTPKQLQDKYSKNEEIHLEMFPANYDKIMKKIGKKAKIVKKDSKLIIYTPNAETTLHHLLHAVEGGKGKLVDVKLNRPTLSEIFESLTGKNEITKDNK